MIWNNEQSGRKAMKKQRFLFAIMFAFLALAAGRVNAQATVDFTVTITSGTETGDVFT
jgi:hypothetical protein